MGGTSSTRGEQMIAYKILIGRREGKVSLWRPGRTCENNIKINLKSTVCEVVDWLQLAEDRFLWWPLVNTVMKIRVP
jgi:hypothetical protein